MDMGVSRIEQCARDSNGVANAESEPRVQLADEGESHERRIRYAPSNAAPR